MTRFLIFDFRFQIGMRPRRLLKMGLGDSELEQLSIGEMTRKMKLRNWESAMEIKNQKSKI